ncbi:MAG: hypothetical protein NVS3B2_18000 [Ramlibacter sp.]
MRSVHESLFRLMSINLPAAHRTALRHAAAQRSPSMASLVGFSLCSIILAACQAERFEVLELVALEEVVLVSPPTQFASGLEPLGSVAAGQAVTVRSCTTRKTHTEIEVTFNGNAAVVWKGSYRLVRRPAGAREPDATSTCAGLVSG